jgi:hypothetical protein
MKTFGILIMSLLCLLLFLGSANAQTAPGSGPIITKDLALSIIAPKIREMWMKADQTKGIRALLYGELLPQGTNVKPAFGMDAESQMLTCQNACWIFFIDKMPDAHFGHPVSIILLDAETGRQQVMETEWWPQVEGPNIQRMQLFRTLASRRDPAMIFFEEMPVMIPSAPLQNFTPPLTPEGLSLGQRATAALLSDGCDGCTAWAVIVCGFNDLPDTFDEDTDGIYAVLKNLGLSDNHIFFVSPHTSHPGVDIETSKPNVKWAIDQVANQSNENDKVLFFYSSHGGINGLTCDIPLVDDENDGISASELDGWLSQIKSKEMAIIIEACHSGSFIGKYKDGTYVPSEDELTGEGKSKRVVFTSASTDTSSFADVDGPDDPNAAADIGSETIYGYILAFSDPAADTNGDGAISFEEGVQYALANDVTFIRVDNTPQFSRTADLDPAKVHHYCYPTSDPNGPYVAECQAGAVHIALNAAGSAVRPPCENWLTYAWDTNCSAASFSDWTSPSPLLTLSPIAQCRECNVSLTVACSDGSFETRCSKVTTTDGTPPVVSCPASKVISCDQSSDPAHTGMATATDNCALYPFVTHSDSVTPGICASAKEIARTWTATDGCGNSSSCMQNINVVDTTPPVLSGVPGNITVECDSVPGTAAVTAADNCDTSVPIVFSETRTNGSCPSNYTLTRTWRTTDSCGNTVTATQVIKVQDTTAPTITSVATAPNVLWPPNHQMVGVTVNATATDNCDTTPVCVISSVSSNEPVNGLGDGDTSPDWVITGSLTANLRAERSGTGNGRIYTLRVTCTDACGNSSVGSTTVTVPHDQKKK